MGKKTFSIISLGCFRNTYDSEVIIKRLGNSGYKYIPDLLDDLDLLVVNTCGFIEEAKKESLNVIKEVISIKKKRNIKKIIVCGCLSQRYKDELAISLPEVDEFWGVEAFSKDFKSGLNLTAKNVAFIKIAEGCINHCSFCAIPLIKGNLKSRPVGDILDEVRFLNSRGIKEVNIIGQDITSWGKDLGRGNDFNRLLELIVKASGNISWIRLIYTHPDNFNNELIEVIAGNKKICNYIDLPIQHINDKILNAMNRKTSKRQLISLINKIRKRIPNVVIRTSIIVGFPGESEAEFTELKGFLNDYRFERLGVFTYSREEGTKASKFSAQVHQATKRKRQRLLMEQQSEIAVELNKSLINIELPVLIEEKEEDTFIGRTQYDAPEVDGLVFVKKKGLKIGEIYDLKIVDFFGYDLIAQ